MNINKNLMSRNHTVRTESPKYIVIHYVGALGDAKANTDYYKSNDVGASADFWVGFNGDIWQGNDYTKYYSWHCGGCLQGSGGASFYGKCKNSNSIGIEMCVKKRSTRTMNATDKDWYFTDATINATVKLVKYLMKELNIDINHVIRHYDVTGKICPNPFVYDTGSVTWKKFKAMIADGVDNNAQEASTTYYRVRKTWSDEKSQIGAYTDLKNAKENCPVGYAVFDENGKNVYKPTVNINTLTTAMLSGSNEDKIKMIAPIYQQVQKETGMLASVGLAQFCLESGFGTTDLAKNANNMHGMKCSLSGNTWTGSVWDGKSKYGKYSPEVYNGQTVMVYSEFRKYPSIINSVRDRAAYFMTAKNGSKLRYPNIASITDPIEQVKLIKAGGYATDPEYVSKLKKIITTYHLHDYDIASSVTTNSSTANVTATTDTKVVKETTTGGKYMFEVGTVKNGSTGNDVKLLQRLLKSNGYKDADGNKLKVDGNCGAKTVYAIKEYQRVNKLTADGTCGAKTWAKILLR